MARHRLITLGRLALVNEHGVEDPIGKRRRKLALLAVLAVAKRPVSRDTLVDLFWGEQPEEKARHSLSDALSHLRSVLGRDAIAARQAEVALTDEAQLDVDAIEMRYADKRRIVELYGGSFLEGVYVAESPRFDSWVARERAQLEQLFVDACATLSREAAKAEQWDECAKLSQRWIDIDVASTEAALLLMRSVRGVGSAESMRAARGQYELLAQRLRTELGLEPAHEVSALSAQIERELAELRPEPVVLAPVTQRSHAAGAQPPITRRRRWPFVVAMAVGILIAGRLLRRRSADAAESARQVVAIASAHTADSDSSVAWLRDGFALMMASSLSRSPTLEVVREEKVGARWSVTTTLTHLDQAYVVQLAVRDMRDGSHHDFAISGTNVLAVADEAAARIRSVADVAAPGPHLADLETANVDAFEHFVRAYQAADEGRYTDQIRELDAAVAADSGFTSAVVARMRIARYYVDTLTMNRLASVYARSAARITRWDQLEQAQYLAFHNGEHARAETLARELVSTFPHDPRAYQVLTTTLSSHGKFAAADSVLQRALQLDSLASAAGHGPCAPCAAYSGLIENYLIVGEIDSAERTARRWLALQPNLPSAWAELATVLAFGGRYDAALEAERHASQLASDDPEYAMRLARIYVMARRLDIADSLTRTWPTSSRDYATGALDLQAVIARERGQYRLAEELLRRIRDEYKDAGLLLVHASQLGQLGRYDEAEHEFETMTPHGVSAEPNSPVMSMAGDRARSFAWHHALEADAIAGSRDTSRLIALADSIGRIGARSYYSRDWGLGAHVRGIVELRRGDARAASLDFAKARFGAAGWTRTNVWLAHALEASGDAKSAARVLRDAYLSPPDAMGRYLTRSELDYEMSKALKAAGFADSARVYAGYALTAWRAADPELRSRLRELRELAQ